LDTIIVGNVDHMIDYTADPAHGLCLVRDPYQPSRSINAVALVPRGFEHITQMWDGEQDDMSHLRRFKCSFVDDLWPGQVLSLKFHEVRRKGLQGALIVYSHGRPKPHQLSAKEAPWLGKHWT